VETEHPGVLSSISRWMHRQDPSEAYCEHCDWHGSKADVLKMPRTNEDGSVFQIDACPNCLRNGGLVYVNALHSRTS
jgi:hypothetical protein